VQTNVLILADGIVAKHFLDRIAKNYITKNRYYIVLMDESIKPKTKSENFYFYHFDPTSFVKLSKLFTRRYNEVVIILGNKVDTLASFENVRRLDKSVNIVVLDRWDLEIEGKNFIRLDANEILANRTVDHLPNVPVIAQNVGLGQGEIMEVLVPFGSAYVYRHIGSIEQKNWRIAAIYRNSKLILPKPDLMIFPNDLLLLIGEPKVLREVFKSIKREVGQFPMPFGRDSYLFIDMEVDDAQTIRRMMLSAVYLHTKLKDRRLYVRVTNPSDIETLEFVKSYESEEIEILIDYRYQKRFSILKQDLQGIRVGLFMLHNELFMDAEIRSFLYERNLPVLSLASNSFEQIKDVSLILTGNPNIENISSILFDIAIQLKLPLKIYEYADTNETDKKLIEHFENLANIFSKPITIEKSTHNPIRKIRQIPHTLLVYPFSKKVVKASRYNIFCTDPEGLFHKLAKHHQIFIPVS